MPQFRTGEVTTWGVSVFSPTTPSPALEHTPSGELLSIQEPRVTPISSKDHGPHGKECSHPAQGWHLRVLGRGRMGSLFPPGQHSPYRSPAPRTEAARSLSWVSRGSLEACTPLGSDERYGQDRVHPLFVPPRTASTQESPSNCHQLRILQLKQGLTCQGLVQAAEVL